MPINFTGIKNISAINLIVPATGNQVNAITFQVINDDYGDDFDKFTKAVEKTNNPDLLMRMSDKGIVSLEVIKEPKEEDYEPDKYSYFVNGAKLGVNDANLPLFTYFAKMTTDVADRPPEEFWYEEEYITDVSFVKRTAIGNIIRGMFSANPQIDLLALVKLLHSEQNVKQNSDKINKAINSTMIDYFG